MCVGVLSQVRPGRRWTYRQDEKGRGVKKIRGRRGERERTGGGWSSGQVKCEEEERRGQERGETRMKCIHAETISPTCS